MLGQILQKSTKNSAYKLIIYIPCHNDLLIKKRILNKKGFNIKKIDSLMRGQILQKTEYKKKVSAYGLILYYFSCHKFINKKYDFSIKKVSFPNLIMCKK